jgi:uncharacterized protein YlxP (DUF503 family)
MKVGLLTLSYRLSGLESIKERRSIIRRLVADVRAEGAAFAVCEIDADGGLQRARLRVAHLSPDEGHTRTTLSRLEKKLDRGNGYELIEASTEIL